MACQERCFPEQKDVCDTAFAVLHPWIFVSCQLDRRRHRRIDQGGEVRMGVAQQGGAAAGKKSRWQGTTPTRSHPSNPYHPFHQTKLNFNSDSGRRDGLRAELFTSTTCWLKSGKAFDAASRSTDHLQAPPSMTEDITTFPIRFFHIVPPRW